MSGFHKIENFNFYDSRKRERLHHDWERVERHGAEDFGKGNRQQHQGHKRCVREMGTGAVCVWKVSGGRSVRNGKGEGALPMEGLPVPGG
jgi:hypothetical protein